MKFPDDRFLFTVKEVSEICDISRTTLLRLEDDGFLTPYHTDQSTGYRYYDVDNITQIGQYKIIMGLGVSRKEAKDLYFLQPNAKELLNEQRQKLARLQRLLDEAEMRIDHSVDYSYSYIDMPEMTCYCMPLSAVSNEDMETLAYKIYQEAIKEGFHVDVTEPLFCLLPEGPDRYFTMCIPLISSDISDPRLRTFPACHAFSTTAHGDYSILPVLLERYKEKFSEHHLKAVGPARLIALVAPCVGEHFTPEDYCCELVVPIEKDGDVNSKE